MDFLQNVSLAPFTTLKIGGPAQYFCQATTPNDLIEALHSPIEPKTILGNGSNVLISDSGLPGLVIKNSVSEIKIVNKYPPKTKEFAKTYTQRQENEPEKYLDFAKLDYDESNLPTSSVEISSGYSLPLVINWTLDQGLTGLQWFAYIPGTMGGATWYNIHGGTYHLADYIKSIKCFDLNTQTTINYAKANLNWEYEKSFFQTHPNLIILSTTIDLFHGNVSLAKSVRDAWIAQKTKIQPMRSAGSVFANPPLDLCQKIWGEQKSTGWIIDHELNLKGFRIGDAQISEKHANFIINLGHATAHDYLAVIRHIQSEAKTKLHLDLEPEIKFLGDFSAPTK